MSTPPPSWSDEKVDGYYGWSEKLLKVLQGTNEGLEVALENLINSHKSKKSESSKQSISLLTKQEINDGYYEGLNIGATHMLIVWDTFDFEDSYNFIVYSLPVDNVVDLVNYHTVPGYYRVSAVYAMHLDIEEQIKEGRPWYTEYPKR